MSFIYELSWPCIELMDQDLSHHTLIITSWFDTYWTLGTVVKDYCWTKNWSWNCWSQAWPMLNLENLLQFRIKLVIIHIFQQTLQVSWQQRRILLLLLTTILLLRFVIKLTLLDSSNGFSCWTNQPNKQTNKQKNKQTSKKKKCLMGDAGGSSPTSATLNLLRMGSRSPGLQLVLECSCWWQ